MREEGIYFVGLLLCLQSWPGQGCSEYGWHVQRQFSCGVYTFVSSHLILLLAKYVLNVFDVYLLPLSVCRILRTFPVSFSMHALHHLKIGKASSLDLQSPT